MRNSPLSNSNRGSQFIRLSELVEVNPSVDVSKLSNEDQVSFIPMADVSDHGQWEGCQKRSLAEVSTGYTTFQENDVLFAKITPCTENGKGCHATGLLNGVGFGSTEFHVLRANNGVHPRLVYHLSVSADVRAKAASLMGGSAGQQRVPSDFVRAVRVSLKAIEQQEYLVPLLDSVDESIEATRAMIDQTRRLKTALLQELLTNGFPGRHKKFKNHKLLGRLPQQWGVRPLGELCVSAIDGPFGSNLKTEHYTDNGCRVIRLQNIGIGEFDDSDKVFISQSHYQSLEGYSLGEGDVVLASMGDESWPAGRCCRIPRQVLPAIKLTTNHNPSVRLSRTSR